MPLIDVDPSTRELVRVIRDLANLPVGWDGENGPALTSEAVEAAGLIVPYLAEYRPHVGPVPGGGIQFDIEQSGGRIELEILPNGIVDFIQIDRDGEPTMEGMVSAEQIAASTRPFFRFLR